MFKIFLFISFLIFNFILLTSTATAVSDPLSVPNNKFGIHIIQATPGESSPAASLVNSSGGDWGYITFLIQSNDRNQNKWQEFFNDLRRRHLIPIVRLATKPVNAHWERPYEGEEEAWADFLDRLNWPTKNRYVIIYNEPNHGKEWGNFVDAKNYAEVLDKTITALKNKNRDFFVLNAGFDASTPSQPPQFEDQVIFMRQMEKAVPEIFNKLDGWVSHSYPNPEFAGSPDAHGRGTVRTWIWELEQLGNLGVTKNLPVFITETGWKHAEGLSYTPGLPNADTVAGYFKSAFGNAWNNNRVIAVTPFLLSYQETPFDHFSFKKSDNTNYYSIFQTIRDLSKTSGKPVQETSAQLIKGEIYSTIVAGESYEISLTFKNSGQSIWDEGVRLVPLLGGKELGIDSLEIPKGIKVEPGEEYTFYLSLKAPESGTYQVQLNLFRGQKQFDSQLLEFTTEVKAPVVLRILTALAWKKNFSGDYTLSVKGATGESFKQVSLDKNGQSKELEAKYLLPDYAFDFRLERPFYKPSTIHQKVFTGINVLDFGVLQPDIISALLSPGELWKLLPFSN